MLEGIAVQHSGQADQCTITAASVNQVGKQGSRSPLTAKPSLGDPEVRAQVGTTGPLRDWPPDCHIARFDPAFNGQTIPKANIQIGRGRNANVTSSIKAEGLAHFTWGKANAIEYRARIT